MVSASALKRHANTSKPVITPKGVQHPSDANAYLAVPFFTNQVFTDPANKDACDWADGEPGWTLETYRLIGGQGLRVRHFMAVGRGTEGAEPAGGVRSQ